MDSCCCESGQSQVEYMQVSKLSFLSSDKHALRSTTRMNTLHLLSEMTIPHDVTYRQAGTGGWEEAAIVTVGN